MSSKKKTRQSNKANANGNRKNWCELCERSFATPCILKEHLRRHLGERPFKCRHCTKAFESTQKLNRHVSTSHSGKAREKIHECTLCGKKFTERGNLNQHMRTHTGEKPHRCEICGKCFVGTTSLKTHLKIHTNERPFECNICSFRFRSRPHLNRHMSTHTNPRPPPPKRAILFCVFCNEGPFTEKGLHLHTIKHIGEKPFICNTCNIEFGNRQNRRLHMKRHFNTEKLYSCNTCGFRYYSKENLKRHELIHEKTKRHICIFCEKEFTPVDLMWSHLRTHTKELPYSCHYCDKEFAYHGNRLVHVKRIHLKQKDFACEVCQKRFVSKSELIRHEATQFHKTQT